MSGVERRQHAEREERGGKQKHKNGDDHPIFGRQPFGAAHAFEMQPQKISGERGEAEVQDDDDHHKYPARACRVADDEVYDEGLSALENAEDFIKALVEDLCAVIPDQPVACDANGPDNNRHSNARDPGQPARPAEAILKEGAPSVQEREDDRCIRCVAVHGADDAPDKVGFDLGDSQVGECESERVE